MSLKRAKQMCAFLAYYCVTLLSVQSVVSAEPPIAHGDLAAYARCGSDLLRHPGSIKILTAANQSKYVASSCYRWDSLEFESVLTIWNCDDGCLRCRIGTGPDYVSSAQISSAGQHVALVFNDGTIECWDLKGKRLWQK